MRSSPFKWSLELVERAADPSKHHTYTLVKLPSLDNAQLKYTTEIKFEFTEPDYFVS